MGVTANVAKMIARLPTPLPGDAYTEAEVVFLAGVGGIVANMVNRYLLGCTLGLIRSLKAMPSALCGNGESNALLRRFLLFHPNR